MKVKIAVFLLGMAFFSYVFYQHSETKKQLVETQAQLITTQTNHRQALTAIQEYKKSDALRAQQRAKLLKKQKELHTLANARLNNLKRLKTDNAAIKNWYDQPLPDDLVQLLDPANPGAGNRGRAKLLHAEPVPNRPP